MDYISDRRVGMRREGEIVLTWTKDLVLPSADSLLYYLTQNSSLPTLLVMMCVEVFYHNKQFFYTN